MGHQHHGGVEVGEIALEPFQRGDVEVVGGLVEQQQVRVPGQRARQRRAGELAAGEALEGPVESLVGESEAVERAERTGAPVPPAGVLEPRLGAGVAVEHRRVVRPLGHGGLEVAQGCLERHEIAAAGEHVVAQ